MTLALPAAALSQIPFAGVVTDDCLVVVIPEDRGAELYAFKMTASGIADDILFDVRAKGGTNAGNADAGTTGALWTVPPNFRGQQRSTDVVFAVLTFPDAGEVHVNGGETAATGGAVLGSLIQRVGHTLPPYPSTSGTGRAPWTTPGIGSVSFNFGMVVDYSDVSPVANPECHLGSLHGDPSTGTGIITGYNVYRVPDTGSIPTSAAFMAGWQGYLSISDRQDPDGVAYTGDEYLTHVDATVSPGMAYWYAAQPVVTNGTLAGMQPLTSSVNIQPLVWDWSEDGIDDAVSLDGTPGGIDFFSPQNAVGIPGYGLTAGGVPLLSEPVIGNETGPQSPGRGRRLDRPNPRSHGPCLTCP